MSGKRYSKTTKRDYYNKDITDEIQFKINKKELGNALILIKKYMQDYPDDILGEYLLATIYEKLGKHEEAYNIAKDAYETNKFHNHQTRMEAARLYARLLMDMEKYDEAEGILLGAIEEDKKRSVGFRSMKAVYALVQLYISTLQYDKALNLIGEHENDPVIECKDNLLVKKGFIYLCQEKYVQAIETLESAHLNNKSVYSQEKHLYLGQAYFQIGQKENNIRLIEKAEDNLKKALTIKGQDYYDAIKTLGAIAYKKNNYDLALQYSQSIIDKKDEDFILPLVLDEAYKTCAKVYMKRGEFAEAKEYLDNIKQEEIYNALIVRYYYSTKQYDECIKLILSILNTCSGDDVNYYLPHLINSYMRIGEIDRARYYFDILIEEFTNKYKERFEGIYRLLKGLPQLPSENYTIQQLTDYSVDRAIDHISRRHIDEEFENFNSKEEALEALKFASEKIKNMEYTPSELMDKYFITTEHMDGKQFGDCNGMVAVTPMGTTNITTLYPISSFRSTFKEEHITKETKVRSGLDRFNARYGNKN